MMATVLGITCGVLALAMAALAMRISGMKGEVEKAKARTTAADLERDMMERNLIAASHEFKNEITKWNAIRSSMRADIELLEKDLEQCSTPEARRKRIQHLFAKVDR